MREHIAVAVSAFAAVLLVTLTIVFAAVRNPDPGSALAEGMPVAEASAPAAAPEAVADVRSRTSEVADPAAADTLTGRRVFEERGCGRCHSAAGVGSGRYPLDGVGSRRSRAELRAWTLGDESLADALPPATLRTKQGFRSIPAADLEALLGWLATLK